MADDFAEVQLVAPTVAESDLRAGGWTVGLRFRPEPSPGWVGYLERLVNGSGRFRQGSTTVTLSRHGVRLLHVPDERLDHLLNTLEGFVRETNRWYAEEHAVDMQTTAGRREHVKPQEPTAADIQRRLTERYGV